MLHERVRRAAVTTLMSAVVGLIWFSSPHPRQIRAAVRHPQAYVDTVGPDRAAVLVVGALAWVLLGWLAVGLLFAAAAAVPGLTGDTCAVLADRMLPAAFRQAAALGLGVSIAAGGASGAAALAHGSADAGPRPAALSAVGAVDWPIGAAVRDPTAAGATAGPAASSTRTALDWPLSPPGSATPDRVVVVRPGDCLWTIAADEIGPDATDLAIAAEWQRWYAVNRAAIGPDPDLIRPGLRLIAPPDRSAP